MWFYKPLEILLQTACPMADSEFINSRKSVPTNAREWGIGMGSEHLRNCTGRMTEFLPATKPPQLEAPSIIWLSSCFEVNIAFSAGVIEWGFLSQASPIHCPRHSHLAASPCISSHSTTPSGFTRLLLWKCNTLSLGFTRCLLWKCNTLSLCFTRCLLCKCNTLLLGHNFLFPVWNSQPCRLATIIFNQLLNVTSRSFYCLAVLQ